MTSGYVRPMIILAMEDTARLETLLDVIRDGKFDDSREHLERQFRRLYMVLQIVVEELLDLKRGRLNSSGEGLTGDVRR